jgi:hypothetical protein
MNETWGRIMTMAVQLIPYYSSLKQKIKNSICVIFFLQKNTFGLTVGLLVGRGPQTLRWV